MQSRWNGPRLDGSNNYIFQCDNCKRIVYSLLKKCPHCNSQMRNYHEKQILMEELEKRDNLIKENKSNE